MARLLNWLILAWMEAVEAIAPEPEDTVWRQAKKRLIERENTGELWGDRENAELH